MIIRKITYHVPILILKILRTQIAWKDVKIVCVPATIIHISKHKYKIQVATFLHKNTKVHYTSISRNNN